MRAIITTLLLTGIAVSAVATDASAQGRRHVAYTTTTIVRSPLTVNRRSWLDPGNAVSHSGSAGPAYMAASTAEFNKTPDKVFAPDRFGNSALPGQPYVPGRTVPVVSFSTLPNGDVVVDNVLHYQPY